MYAEMINHILVHKYYLNQNITEEISFDKAALHWYREVFLPIFRQIKEDGLLQTFPGKTYGDLYMWIVRRWDELKRSNSDESETTLEKAVSEVVGSEHIPLLVKIKERIKKYFS